MSQVCVITGGTSGIGRCTAQAMLARGYTVYELSRRAEGVAGMQHIVADVTKEETLAAAVAQILQREDHIDVLINNAGFGISGAVEFTGTEEAQRQLDVNFFGMVRMNRQVLPVMRKQGYGRIVNLSSVAGTIPIPFQTYYSASTSVSSCTGTTSAPSDSTARCLSSTILSIVGIYACASDSPSHTSKLTLRFS